jgi:hypothetical protein
VGWLATRPEARERNPTLQIFPILIQFQIIFESVFLKKKSDNITPHNITNAPACMQKHVPSLILHLNIIKVLFPYVKYAQLIA